MHTVHLARIEYYPLSGCAFQTHFAFARSMHLVRILAHSLICTHVHSKRIDAH